MEPPHDPDELCPFPHMRPCSMARQDIPPAMRCVIMLKADHAYRMCDNCRMKFKLGEMRAKGVRYEGKQKARMSPEESIRGRKYTKVLFTSTLTREKLT